MTNHTNQLPIHLAGLAMLILFIQSCNIVAASSSNIRLDQKPERSHLSNWNTAAGYNAYVPCTETSYEVIPDPKNGYKDFIIDPFYDSPAEFAKRRYYRGMARDNDPNNAAEYDLEQANDNAKMNALWCLSDDEGNYAFYNTSSRTVYMAKHIEPSEARDLYISNVLPILRKSRDGRTFFTCPDHKGHDNLSRSLEDQDAAVDEAYSHLEHVLTQKSSIPPARSNHKD